MSRFVNVMWPNTEEMWVVARLTSIPVDSRGRCRIKRQFPEMDENKWINLPNSYSPNATLIRLPNLELQRQFGTWVPDCTENASDRRCDRQVMNHSLSHCGHWQTLSSWRSSALLTILEYPPLGEKKNAHPLLVKKWARLAERRDLSSWGDSEARGFCIFNWLCIPKR